MTTEALVVGSFSLPSQFCCARTAVATRHRQSGSGIGGSALATNGGKPVCGQVLELGCVLTAKFLTQLTGLLVVQARLGEITALAILESETNISGRIVRVHFDRFLVSFDGTLRVRGFRVRKSQVVI